MTGNQIEVLTHSSIKISGSIVIYADPFRVKEEMRDADLILLTHDHFDHFSPEDIARVVKADTKLVIPERMKEQTEKAGLPVGEIHTIAPGMTKELAGITIEAVLAYNPDKPFHPKEDNWIGYILTMAGERIYIAGDTDITEENQKICCDVAMVPIGGTYTMDAEQAARLVNIIRPRLAIPTHYGSVAGSKKDEEVFRAHVDQDILVEIKDSTAG